MSPEAEIDPAALRHNLARVRHCCPESRIWAVVKADGYGHGMLRMAELLKDAEGLAVARTEEGLRLRDANQQGAVLVLEGPLNAEELRLSALADLEICVHHERQLALLERQPRLTPLRVWIKLDTGMHRLGFPPERVRQVFERLARCPAVQGLPRLMTHLANADDRDHPYNRHQLRSFDNACRSLPKTQLSVANSAAVLAWPEAGLDWVRPGIMLYGVSPFMGETGSDQGLKPVMTLTAPLIAVNRHRAGQPVGYGGGFVCPETMPVGVVGIGYGDGYPRHAPNGTPVLLDGRTAPLVGRVSMDMMCVDLRDHPQAKVGDRTTLWGSGLPVERIARAADTIAYQLLCGVTGRVSLRETPRRPATGSEKGGGDG